MLSRTKFVSLFALVLILTSSLVSADAMTTRRTRSTEKIEVFGVVFDEIIQGVATIASSKTGISTLLVRVKIRKDPSQEGKVLPANAFSVTELIARGNPLEAWLTDLSPLESANLSSANSEDSNRTGGVAVNSTPVGSTIGDVNGNQLNLANVPVNNISESAPYNLSCGKMVFDRASDEYRAKCDIRNGLEPYDMVKVSLELNGNLGNYDPRMGLEVAAGVIPN